MTLVPTYTLGALTLTDYPYSVRFGSDLGQPSLEDEPREMTVTVGIEGTDLLELAENEAALRREINKPLNEFSHNPGDGFAPTSVFDTTLITATPIRYEDGGEQTCYREWELSIEAEPHARSATPVTVDALAVETVAASTTIDTCDSATGWTATVNGVSHPVSTTWSAGAVSVVELIDPSPQTLALMRTGSINFTPERYLVVEVGFNASFGPIPISCLFHRTGAPPRVLEKASQRLISPGWYECIFDTGGETATAVAFSGEFPMEYADLKIRNVAKRNQPATLPKQGARIINTGGTERTPASIRVGSPDGTTPLGLTFVHTQPEDGSGNAPDLRRWRTSGNLVTPDATCVSGARERLHPNPVAFEIPTASLPQGGYQLGAIIAVDVAGDHPIYFSSYTRLPAPNDTELMGEVINRVVISFPLANAWVFVPLGLMGLPTVATASGKVVIGIQRDSGSTVNMEYDEALLFRVDDDCGLTIAHVPAPNLWLESPTSTSPVSTVWMGTSESSRTHPGEGLLTPGSSHVLHADGTAIWAATVVDWANVSGTFSRRWHSNAAE